MNDQKIKDTARGIIGALEFSELNPYEIDKVLELVRDDIECRKRAFTSQLRLIDMPINDDSLLRRTKG
jgi:hypothetical protein